jgi:hypothetical protein
MTESNNSNKPSDQILNLTERLSRTNKLTGYSGREFVSRQQENAIPRYLGRLLTREQQSSLNILELFGWRVWFVRRPLFGKPKVMIQHEASGVYALLTEDGNVDMEPDFPMRHD